MTFTPIERLLRKQKSSERSFNKQLTNVIEELSFNNAEIVHSELRLLNMDLQDIRSIHKESIILCTDEEFEKIDEWFISIENKVYDLKKILYRWQRNLKTDPEVHLTSILDMSSKSVDFTITSPVKEKENDRHEEENLRLSDSTGKNINCNLPNSKAANVDIFSNEFSPSRFEVARSKVAHSGSLHSEVISPETTHSSTIRPEVTHSKIVRPEVARSKVNRPEVANSNAIRPEVARSQVVRSDVHRSKDFRAEVPRSEVTCPEVVRSNAISHEFARTNNVRSETARFEVIHPGVVCPEVARSEVARSEVVRPEVACSEVVCSEVARSEFVRPDVARAEVIRPQVGRSEVIHPEVVRSDLVRPEVARAEVVRPQVTHSQTFHSEIACSPDVRPKFAYTEVVHPEINYSKFTRSKNVHFDDARSESFTDTSSKVDLSNGARSEIVPPEAIRSGVVPFQEVSNQAYSINKIESWIEHVNTAIDLNNRVWERWKNDSETFY